MKNTRHSKQRDRILEILKNTKTHPTAGWIYNEMIKESPDISMGTIYRNLNILLEQGLIKKIEFGSTFDRFEANTEPHYHFICEKCHAIIDLDFPVDDEMNEMIFKKTGFRPTRHKVEFFGVCEKCSGK